MWPSIARTGRRLLGVAAPASRTAAEPAADPRIAPGAEAEALVPPDEAPRIDDLLLTIGRPELERLATALQALLGPGTARPDTPARLEAALAQAVERLGGSGRPRVTRRPPGLYTPEAWQVRLTQVDPAIGEAIRGAARGAGLAR